MPRSHRSVILAVVGWLILGDVNQSQAQQAGASNRAAADIAVTPTPADKLTAKEYQPECYKPRDGNEASACASLRQAKAAEQANAISTDTLLWNKIGILAVILTLAATAWAAWAAGRAARLAARSVELFEQAEGAFLAPQVKLYRQGGAIGIGLVNRGKTPGFVLVADLLFSNEPINHAVPVFLSGGYEVDVLVAPNNNYDFGILTLTDFANAVFIAGGIIYRDSFGKAHVAKIALRIDREAETYQITHEANLDKWERFARRLNCGKKIRKSDLT